MFPSNLVIGVSTWYGITIYTKKDVVKDCIICVTELSNFNDVDGYLMSDYGNVFNHSDDANYVNCQMIIQENDLVKIVALRDIKHGEELLVNYNDYLLVN